MQQRLIQKYNVPGPRYTSYPTVPYWDEAQFTAIAYRETLIRAYENGASEEGISLYIHLPFCESMCTFCSCTKKITRNHDVERPYIETLLKELDLYVTIFGEKPWVKEIHLGGGTPTFFDARNLQRLIQGLFKRIRKHASLELSFEGHPNNTTQEHLETFRHLGFTKVSFGVQDYNDTVQKAIHRVQPFEHVKKVTEMARELGYTSIGHDLIFGLPFQKREHIERTISLTRALQPDRIAFYSYAHVPWIKGNGQRGFDESDLPSATEKRAQYELGKNLLEEAGYHEIGMDHFSLKSDTLYASQQNKSIHRNFMGYTPATTTIMIGLGISAIGDSWMGFAQNVKNIEEYTKRVDQGQLPLFRGHLLNEEDGIIRRHILNLMCRFETNWNQTDGFFPELPDVLIQLKEMENDGLVVLESNNITVTEKGKPFVRNVCMAFDLRLQRKKPESRLFSMTV